MKSVHWLLCGCAVLAVSACSDMKFPWSGSSTPPATAAAPPPPPQPQQTAVVPPRAEVLNIYFDNNSTQLGKSAMGMVDHAAQLYGQNHPGAILIEGHADRTGGEQSNNKLSADRAEAVKRAMVARGIPANVIQTRAEGWNNEPVSDQPGQAEPRDRVVVVTLR